MFSVAVGLGLIKLVVAWFRVCSESVKCWFKDVCFELVSGCFRVSLGLVYAGRAEVGVQGVKGPGSGDRSSRASIGGGNWEPGARDHIWGACKTPINQSQREGTFRFSVRMICIMFFLFNGEAQRAQGFYGAGALGKCFLS